MRANPSSDETFLPMKSTGVGSIAKATSYRLDYLDIAYLVATALVQRQVDGAILVCATGMGMCLAANNVKGGKGHILS